MALQEFIRRGPDGRPTLIGARCRRCGWVTFPRVAACPDCFAPEAVEECPLSRRGILYSYAVAAVAPPGFLPPLVQGYVDLPEGIRLFAHLAGDSGTLKLGMAVELDTAPIGRDARGGEIEGYVFRPIVSVPGGDS